MKDVHQLELLSLANKVLGSGVSVLASYLQSVPNLMVLELENTNMTEIVVVLYVPQLMSLGLKNTSIGRGVITLAESPAKVPKLKYVDLCNTGMDELSRRKLSRTGIRKAIICG